MLLICGIIHRYADQQVHYCDLPEAPYQRRAVRSQSLGIWQLVQTRTKAVSYNGYIFGSADSYLLCF